MAGPRIGYLLPTRERVMTGEHATAPLLALAERAERAGFDSIWIGDSVTARPRHDPMTLMAAVAARTTRVEIGTAVLLPALRNPVLLAHQWATLDRISEGRVILGVGIASDVPNIRDEFEASEIADAEDMRDITPAERPAPPRPPAPPTPPTSKVIEAELQPATEEQPTESDFDLGAFLEEIETSLATAKDSASAVEIWNDYDAPAVLESNGHADMIDTAYAIRDRAYAKLEPYNGG